MRNRPHNDDPITNSWQPEELTYEKEKDPFPKVRVARERVQMSLRAGLTRRPGHVRFELVCIGILVGML
jgi:hypothetical protein